MKSIMLASKVWKILYLSLCQPWFQEHKLLVEWDAIMDVWLWIEAGSFWSFKHGIHRSKW